MTPRRSCFGHAAGGTGRPLHLIENRPLTESPASWQKVEQYSKMRHQKPLKVLGPDSSGLLTSVCVKLVLRRRTAPNDDLLGRLCRITSRSGTTRPRYSSLRDRKASFCPGKVFLIESLVLALRVLSLVKVLMVDYLKLRNKECGIQIPRAPQAAKLNLPGRRRMALPNLCTTPCSVQLYR